MFVKHNCWLRVVDVYSIKPISALTLRTPAELLATHGIDATAIVKAVTEG